MASEQELAALRRAVDLSRAALGTTNPNPCVGAVVLDASGVVVGEGVTQPIGGDHAEVGALRAAGDAARGGTVVVTLEPCCHTGRTARCTDAIQAAGVARVVYARSDPHDIAAGGGAQLRAAGIDVEAGVLVEEADTVLGRWVTAMSRNRPHLTWKYAATLDGRTAAVDGTSQWITGEVARRDVHRERYETDAVIVGIGTVLADDPQLTVRDWPAARQPLRVVIDSDARTPTQARVLDEAAPTMIVVAADADPDRRTHLAATAEVVTVPRAGRHVDLTAAMAALFDRGVAIAFLEGGATLAAGFVRANLVDRVLGYHAPMLLGAGAPMLGDVGITTLADGPRFAIDAVAALGADVRITAQLTARRA